MQLQDFYPIIVTEHLLACRDFYRRWFELEVAFEASPGRRCGRVRPLSGRGSPARAHAAGRTLRATPLRAS